MHTMHILTANNLTLPRVALDAKTQCLRIPTTALAIRPSETIGARATVIEEGYQYNGIRQLHRFPTLPLQHPSTSGVRIPLS